MIEKLEFVFNKIEDENEREEAISELKAAKDSKLWQLLLNNLNANIDNISDKILDHPDMSQEDNRVYKLYRNALIVLRDLPDLFLKTLDVEIPEDVEEKDDPYLTKEDLKNNKK